TGKEKLEEVVKEKEKRKRIAVSESKRITKKPRTQKKEVTRKLVIQENDDEETEDEPLQTKRKRTEPKVKEVNAEANAGTFHSNIDYVASSQAQNQTLPESELDPALFQPLNVIHPPQMSDIPPITSDSDIDTVAEILEIASEVHKN
ncbi:hypothetical protein A2U01_0054313, partial [Trifolium medium]|nr:hypothetical protein [Trifolium medium]